MGDKIKEGAQYIKVDVVGRAKNDIRYGAGIERRLGVHPYLMGGEGRPCQDNEADEGIYL